MSEPPTDPTPLFSQAVAAVNNAATAAELVEALNGPWHPHLNSYWVATTKQRAADLAFDGDLAQFTQAFAAKEIEMYGPKESRTVPVEVVKIIALTISDKTQTSRIMMPCQHCGTVAMDPEAVFCGKCGERIVSEEIEALTRSVLDIVEATVPKLIRSQIDRTLSKQSVRSFSWMEVPNEEKWKVTWGILGRTILIQVGFWTIAFLLLVVASR